MELGISYVEINEERKEYLIDLGVKHIYNTIRWCNIQPRSADEFIWNSYDFEFEQEKSLGITGVRAISHTPVWAAQFDNPYWTSPPKSLTDWCIFIKTLVLRYPGRTWTIWAEPDNYPPRESKDLICFTGTAESYAEMLESAYTTAKKWDPSCTIGIGGLLGVTINGSFPYAVFNDQKEDRLVFLEKLVDLGMMHFADMIGLDAYFFGYGGMQNIRQGISRIRKITKRKPMWILETGCKITPVDKIGHQNYKQQYGHEPVTQESAAGLMFSLCKLANEFDIKKIFWLTLQSSEWGLVNRLGRKHLTYHMFKMLNRYQINPFD